MDSGNQEIDRLQSKARKPGGRTLRVSDLEFALALKKCDGDRKLVANVLGLAKASVDDRIKNNPELSALYGGGSSKNGGGVPRPDPTELSTMTRTPADIPSLIEGSDRAEALMAQDREIMRAGLQAAGIKPETIERIRSLDGLAKNSGRMISASLDYTHRLHIFSTAALFEEMIYIRDTHLRNTGADPMVTVFWQRAFNEIADLLGKSNDRTMNTAQALAAMMKNQDGGKKNGSGPKSKPGW